MTYFSNQLFPQLVFVKCQKTKRDSRKPKDVQFVFLESLMFNGYPKFSSTYL